MPKITASTKQTDFTVSKQTFRVFQPYAAGHVLTEGEASALNQVWAENVRNNHAKKLDAAKTDGSFKPDQFQKVLDDYQRGYEFGNRASGSRSSDPVRTEAMKIGREKVTEALLANGYKLADVPAKEVSRLASELLESPDGAAILKIASKRVEEAKTLAGKISIGTVNLQPKKAAEPAAA